MRCTQISSINLIKCLGVVSRARAAGRSGPRGGGSELVLARLGQECRGQANLFGAEFGPLVLIKCGGSSKTETAQLHKERKKYVSLGDTTAGLSAPAQVCRALGRSYRLFYTQLHDAPQRTMCKSSSPMHFDSARSVCVICNYFSNNGTV